MNVLNTIEILSVITRIGIETNILQGICWKQAAQIIGTLVFHLLGYYAYKRNLSVMAISDSVFNFILLQYTVVMSIFFRVLNAKIKKKNLFYKNMFQIEAGCPQILPCVISIHTSFKQ